MKKIMMKSTLKKILQDVNLDQFISNLPKGIDTNINEMGTDISEVRNKRLV